MSRGSVTAAERAELQWRGGQQRGDGELQHMAEAARVAAEGGIGRRGGCVAAERGGLVAGEERRRGAASTDDGEA